MGSVAYVVFDAAEKVQRLNEIGVPSWKRLLVLENLSFECCAWFLEGDRPCVVFVSIDYTFEESSLRPELDFITVKNEFYQLGFLEHRCILPISMQHRLDLLKASTFPFGSLLKEHHL